MLNEIVRLGSFGLLGGESSTVRRVFQTCLDPLFFIRAILAKDTNEFYTATTLSYIGMSYFRQAKPKPSQLSTVQNAARDSRGGLFKYCSVVCPGCVGSLS